MFHCFINYKVRDSRCHDVFMTEQFHISARTEQDIRNMEHIISELLDRLGVEHSSRFWLDSPLKQLKMKTDNPYDEIVEIFRKRNKAEDSFIAWVYTEVLGYDVVFCDYNGGKDCYEWLTDWYEGGDCYLLYIAAIDDVEPTIDQKWGGYDE